MTGFINGKRNRVKRPALIDGMDVDELIQRTQIPSNYTNMNVEDGNTISTFLPR
jgi:hypothetical protein